MNSGNKQKTIFIINFHIDALASAFIWKSCLSYPQNFLILFYLSYLWLSITSKPLSSLWEFFRKL